MKKAKFFLGILSIALIGFFTACESDEEAKGPSIILAGSDGYIAADKTVEPGDDLPFSWSATKGDAKLTTFTIEMNGNIVPAWNNVEIPNSESDAYSAADTLTASVVDGIYTYKFIVEDKDGMADTATVVITVESPAPAGTLATHTITLGAQSNATGSFYASLDGSTYTIAELKATDSYNKIDLIYYVGNTNKEAIFSPKQIVASPITWESAIPVANWGTSPNETKFVKAEAADYDDATYENVETLATSASLDIANGGASPIAGLKVNDVYGFKTAGGLYGVFKVTAVTTGNTGTISLSVKVQE